MRLKYKLIYLQNYIIIWLKLKNLYIVNYYNLKIIVAKQFKQVF
jgi:hypothetical protein